MQDTSVLSVSKGERNICKYITGDVEISSDYSDREDSDYSDRKGSDKENSNEERNFE